MFLSGGCLALLCLQHSSNCLCQTMKDKKKTKKTTSVVGESHFINNGKKQCSDLEGNWGRKSHWHLLSNAAAQKFCVYNN